MSNDTYFLGIDVGTTGAKAILLDAAGSVKAEALAEYPLSNPRPLWSEQDPEDWWLATVASIHEIIQRADIKARQIASVGLTGQMHGLVMLDGAGRVLRPAILWNDQRSGEQCRQIHERVGFETVIRITGKPALTGFTAPKILWVREHEPDVFASTRKMLLPKDYVRYRMTGEYHSDVADASGTSLFDVNRRSWSSDMLAAFDLPESAFPDVHESHMACATVRTESECGLSDDTIVVAGAGDQAAEALGCGIIDHEDVCVAIGTSGVVFAAMDDVEIDPEGKLHAYCHAAPGKWHLMGVMLSAGGSLRWHRDTLGNAEKQKADHLGIDAYDLLLREAAKIDPGSDGLFFLPYLSGERTPYADPHARGGFVGLTLRHTKAHMTRAVIEGITFGLMDSLQLAHGLGIQPRKIRISGGGTRNALWRQILADVFGTEIATVNVTQGAALGAALLASVGAGVHATAADAAKAIVREMIITQPGSNSDLYAAYHRCYQAMYPALAGLFRTISSLPGE